MMQEKSETAFVDAEVGFTGGKAEDLNFRFTIMMHLNRIMKASGCEWHGGFWQSSTVIGMGGQAVTTRKYIPDSRQVFANNVLGLYDASWAHLQGHEAQKKVEDVVKRIDTMHKELANQMKKSRDENETGIGMFANAKSVNFELIMLYRELLRELMVFLKAKSFFEQGGIES